MVVKPYARKVQYYETDQMGVVHHSNYIRWMEEARIDFLEQAGIPYHKLEEAGVMVPVLSCSCRFKKPLRFAQSFTVVAQLVEFNGVRFRVEYEIYNGEAKAPAAFGETEHCFANADLKPIRIEKRYPYIFERMQGTLVRERVPL